MAHNINYNEQTGKHAFFSVKEKAWHGLGQIVQDCPTSEEAISLAGLNYRVEKRKLFTHDNGHRLYKTDQPSANLEVPNYFATIRTDNEAVLGVVGKDYEIVQNTDAFSFFDAIVGGDGRPTGQTGIQYETAGALGKGERVFITAKLSGYITVANKDLIERYLFLTTSHHGLGSITAAFTPVRIVCNNTLNAALKQSTNSIKIRHTANAKERLDEAHKVLGISNRISEQLEGLFNQWAKVRITDTEVRKLIQLALTPNKEVLRNIHTGKDDALSTRFSNLCNAVYEYNFASPSQQTESTKGTVFGAYNAVTGYFQNVKGYKNDEAKIKSLLYGGTAQLRTQKAFDLCQRFCNAGTLDSLLN